MRRPVGAKSIVYLTSAVRARNSPDHARIALRSGCAFALRCSPGTATGIDPGQSSQRLGVDTGENPTRVWVYEVTDNYFDVLGVHLYLGRFFHDG